MTTAGPPASRYGAPLLAAAVLALAVGCGTSDPPQTPAACLSGPAAYLDALRAAPAEVRLDGSVAIGDCLVDEQGAGEIADVGQAAVAAATRLNAEGRRDPTGSAPLELGYLLGALEEAASGTGGIHADLVRRIETAARFAPQGHPLPSEFRREFAQGLAAGHSAG